MDSLKLFKNIRNKGTKLCWVCFSSSFHPLPVVPCNGRQTMTSPVLHIHLPRKVITDNSKKEDTRTFGGLVWISSMHSQNRNLEEKLYKKRASWNKNTKPVHIHRPEESSRNFPSCFSLPKRLQLFFLLQWAFLPATSHRSISNIFLLWENDLVGRGQLLRLGATRKFLGGLMVYWILLKNMQSTIQYRKEPFKNLKYGILSMAGHNAQLWPGESQAVHICLK